MPKGLIPKRTQGLVSRMVRFNSRIRVFTFSRRQSFLCASLYPFRKPYLRKLLSSGKGIPAARIGIEIIVHMDSVHVVTADDITHYPANKLTAFRQSRVEKDLFIISDKPFRDAYDRCGNRRNRCFPPCSPGKDSTKRETPCSVYGILGLGRPSGRTHLPGLRLLSGEEAAPRLDIGFIESVRLGAHLKDDGVDAACLQVIKLADEVFFHPGGSHILVFALKSGLYPCSPLNLSLGLLARTRSRTRLREP